MSVVPSSRADYVQVTEQFINKLSEQGMDTITWQEWLVLMTFYWSVAEYHWNEG